MSDVDTTYDVYGHDGTCGHCGTSVKQGFVTCTGCGAVWRSVVSIWGALVIKAAFIVPMIAAFIALAVAQSAAAFTFTLFGLAFLMVVLGLSMRTTGWFR